MSFNFTGTGVALVTPFGSDGAIDFNALGRLVDHVVNGGVEYLVVLGTTGETATLTGDEKTRVFEFVKKHNAGRAGLVAGLGGNNTAELLHVIGNFDFSGYDALLSVSPYYNKPNQEGIYLHYKAVAEKSPVPVIVYNVPGRTGSNISAATCLRIAGLPNVKANKEASGNLEQCMDILNQKPDGFHVISGDDALTLPFLSMGMGGVISVVANAYPRQFSDMVRAGLAGDFVTARALHYRLYEISKLIFADGSPGGIKCILKQMGICGDTVRLPLANVNKTVEEHLLTEAAKI